MDNFLAHRDTLGRNINDAALDLYARLKNIDANGLGLPEHCLYYYNASHSQRLFFSIETSAHLLYNAITLSGKEPGLVTIMDYGAGVGTLYLLASLAGCKKVIYNDHLDDWRVSALKIAEAAGISIDKYIVGDIDICLQQLREDDIRCDIITSRNVVEHIYDLRKFFDAVYKAQPGAIIYSSTTANNKNPAAVIKHNLWHRKWEKVYRGKRMVIIDRQAPGLAPGKRRALARATRGLALSDLQIAIENYRKTGALPDAGTHRGNTCDPDTGVWAEHLLTQKDYRHVINENHYDIMFAPGFWDTHYPQPWKNRMSRIMNRLMAGNNANRIRLAPFIYVIAKPKISGRPNQQIVKDGKH